ncbi:MAG: hypothetical protein JWO31_1650, partial [Phycisphaerales bacterium]|nr:hypothetical protein [Phycisphaerales bacterium]
PAAVALAGAAGTVTAEARPAAAAILLGLREGASRPMPGPLAAALRSRGDALATDAMAAAVDAAKPVKDRVAALAAVPLGNFERARDPLAKLLGGREPQAVQLAAVAALGSFATEPAVADALTSAWPRLTPGVRAVALDVLLARPAWAATFLSAIEAGKLPPTDLDATRLARLRQSKDPAVRKLADAVAARAQLSPRADVVTAYRPVLDAKGDAVRGKALFAQNCATCHRLDDVGVEIGPNLAAMRSRGPEAILVNVLDPNREVNGQYAEYVVETKDGRSLAGLLSAETAAAVTLLKPGGGTETVAGRTSTSSAAPASPSCPRGSSGRSTRRRWPI